MALLILQRKLNTQHDKGFPFLLCYSYGDPPASPDFRRDALRMTYNIHSFVMLSGATRSRNIPVTQDSTAIGRSFDSTTLRSG